MNHVVSVVARIKTFLFCARKIEVYSIRNEETGEKRYYLDIGRYLKPGTYRGGSMTVENSPLWCGFSFHLFRRESHA